MYMNKKIKIAVFLVILFMTGSGSYLVFSYLNKARVQNPKISAEPEKQPGILVLEKDNPSGLPENYAELRAPVKSLVSLEKIKIKVFFNNNILDPASCNEVFPVEREIIKTAAVARAALTELLAGTTSEEERDGFVKIIGPDVKIQSLTIENGVAKVDFNEQLEAGSGGSCRSVAIIAQITATLRQFSSVKNVIISINGRTEDILQP